MKTPSNRLVITLSALLVIQGCGLIPKQVVYLDEYCPAHPNPPAWVDDRDTFETQARSRLTFDWWKDNCPAQFKDWKKRQEEMI